MFNDINKVILVGNVTRDPELRFTPSGTAVLNFSIATNRRYQVDGEWKDAPSYHNIVVWRNAESLAKRIKKGTRLYVEGRLDTRSWEGDDGKKNYKTEVNVDVVSLISRYEGGDSGAADSSAPMPTEKKSSKSSAPAASEEVESIDPDDLPF